MQRKLIFRRNWPRTMQNRPGRAQRRRQRPVPRRFKMRFELTRRPLLHVPLNVWRSPASWRLPPSG